MRFLTAILVLSSVALGIPISGQANIYGAGYGDTPAPLGGGGGLVPVEVVLPGGHYVCDGGGRGYGELLQQHGEFR